MKSKKIVFLVLETLLTFLLCILSVVTIKASFDNSKSERLVKEFIDSCSFEFESDNVRYYSVEGKYHDTIHLNLNPVSGLYDSPTLGSNGDIFAICNSNINVLPFSSDFISYLFGGHAGIVLDDKMIIETSGMNDDNNNKVTITANNLMSEKRIVIGLRTNGTAEEIKYVTDEARKLENKPYNHLFLFSRANSYYCTDLVSRSFNKANIKLDNSMVYTSVCELINSNKTDIIFVKIVIGEISYLYYQK